MLHARNKPCTEHSVFLFYFKFVKSIPSFSCYIKLFCFVVICNSVQNIVGIARFVCVKTAEIDCFNNLSAAFINNYNFVAQPYVSPDVTVNLFQLIDVIDFFAVFCDGYISYVIEFGIHKINTGCAVACNEMLAVRGQSPAFPGIIE